MESGLQVAQSMKTVIIGDEKIGKSSMLLQYAKKTFIQTLQPTVFENFSVTVEIGERTFDLNLFDTAGEDGSAKHRILCYPNTDIFVICFSLHDPVSEENVYQKWLPEINHFYGMNAKFIIVGTKTDLVTNNNKKQMKQKYKERGVRAKNHGALGYYECSATTHREIHEIFDSVIKTVLNSRQVKTVNSSHTVLSVNNCYYEGVDY